MSEKEKELLYHMRDGVVAALAILEYDLNQIIEGRSREWFERFQDLMGAVEERQAQGSSEE